MLTVTNAAGTDTPTVLARDGDTSRRMLAHYRDAVARHGGALVAIPSTRDGVSVWHAMGVDGIHYATVTLT